MNFILQISSRCGEEIKKPKILRTSCLEAPLRQPLGDATSSSHFFSNRANNRTPPGCSALRLHTQICDANSSVPICVSVCVCVCVCPPRSDILFLCGLSLSFSLHIRCFGSINLNSSLFFLLHPERERKSRCLLIRSSDKEQPERAGAGGASGAAALG